MKKVILVLVLLVVLVAVAAVVYPMLTENYQPETPAVINGTAPDFTMTDYAGNARTLSSFYTGKPLVVNFWATWCGYCVYELPDFEAAAKTYQDVDFILVNEGEDPAKALSFLNDRGITIPSYYDQTGSGDRAYQITGIPVTLFIDRHGDLYYHQVGMLTADRLNSLVEQVRNAE